MTYASQAALFLISTTFGFFCLIFLLRFWLQVIRADFYNPLVQSLVKLTNPILRPMRRVIPGYFGLDMAALVALFALKLTELVLIGLTGGLPFVVRIARVELQPLPILGLAIADLLFLAANVALFIIIASVLASWLNPDPRHPGSRLLAQCSQPLLRPIRAFLPDAGGLDFSPMLASILLILIKILLIQPLWDMSALGLASRAFTAAPPSLWQ